MRAVTEAGGFDIVVVDEPQSSGGTNTGPQPTDLQLASITSCFTLAMAYTALHAVRDGYEVCGSWTLVAMHPSTPTSAALSACPRARGLARRQRGPATSSSVRAPWRCEPSWSRSGSASWSACRPTCAVPRKVDTATPRACPAASGTTG
jgi:hypothetical protein